MARDKQRLKLQYAGMTSSPDDYLSPDGELMASFGLDDQSGAKVSAMKNGPKEISNASYKEGVLERNVRLVYVHNMNDRKVAIYELEKEASRGYSYVWIDVTEEWPTHIDQDSFDGNLGIERYNISKIKSIGNTLICSGGTLMHYLVFKSSEEETGYKYLGSRLPVPTITFGLQSKFQHYFDGTKFPTNAENDTDSEESKDEDFFYLDIDKVTEWTTRTEDYYNLKSENVSYVTEEIMAKINKCVYEGSEKGWFMQPFLVRYALKLYDGSTSMASAPVYMPVCDPSTRGVSPMALIDVTGGKSGKDNWHIDVMRSALDYAIEETSLNELKEWGDIVKGVVIGITSPIYTYKPGDRITGVYTEFARKGLLEIRSVTKDAGLDDNIYKGGSCNSFSSGENLYPSVDGYTHSVTNIGMPALCARLGYKSKIDYEEELKNRSVFYVLKSIDTEDLKTERTIIKTSKGFLNTIESQLTLKDSYNAQEIISAEYMYVYNGRLNIANVTRHLWKDFDPTILWAYQYEPNLSGNVSVTFEIEEDGERSVIKSASKNIRGYLNTSYIFYPNTNVKNVWITEDISGMCYFRTMKMQEHTGLNGSVAYDNLGVLIYSYDTQGEDPSPAATTNSYTSKRKLYTSNALNPFVFEPSNINSIGDGEILGMAVAAKAISVGQAGVYPMYCMTDRGVWILEVSDTGGWKGKQAIMSDVCTVPEAIIETDGAVIMPTKRGLMLLQGEQSVCIIDSSKRRDITVSDLPRLDHALRDKWSMSLGEDAIPDIEEYLNSKKLKGIYDYKYQRVIYYREDKQYCLILTTGDQSILYCQNWSIKNAVRDIDSCYLTISDGTGLYIADLNNKNHELEEGVDHLSMSRDALIITRPIKGTEIGMRDVRKQLDVLWHQGRYRRGSFDILLYGTEDYDKWHLIGQAKDATGLYGHHGQHWMAFVVVIYVKNMQEKDYIDCIDLTMTARLSQKSAAISGYK